MSLILSSKHTVTKGEETTVVERGQLKSAWGTQIEPLGFDRFKTCELMAELLHCSNMGLLNERGSEEFIRERDFERERLRAQGAFLSPKQSEDSAVDISVTSSRFETTFSPSESASGEELRIVNNVEEDGFEKVAVSEASEALTSTLASQQDLVDEPLSPRQPQSHLSPPGNLDETVRRLSLDNPEDTDMTSPPNEPETVGSPSASHSSPSHVKHENLPHYFPSSRIQTRHPQPVAQNPLRAPVSPRMLHLGLPQASQAEGESFQTTQDDTTEIVQPGSTDFDEAPVVGDYLKIMFVENRVVPTILVSRSSPLSRRC